MEFSEGFLPPEYKGKKVLRLLHTLYSLKQGGLTWWYVLDKSMKELGFEQLKTNAGLFVYTQGNEIVLAIHSWTLVHALSIPFLRMPFLMRTRHLKGKRRRS